MIASLILSAALAAGLQGQFSVQAPSLGDQSIDTTFVFTFEQVNGNTVAWLTSLADDLVQAPVPEVHVEGAVTELRLSADLGGRVFQLSQGDQGQWQLNADSMARPLRPIVPQVNPMAWAGFMPIASGDLEPMVLHVGANNTARLARPSIALRDFPIAFERHDNGTLAFTLPTRVPTTVLAKPVGDQAEGMVTRGDVMVPITFHRNVETLPIRPQEPVGDVAWTSEQVRMPLRIETNITGTVVMPEPGIGLGKPPLVVLIPSRGLNRDGTEHGHRPLLVLADRLARVGVATVRFDAPGAGDSDPWPAVNGRLTTKLWSLQITGLVEQFFEDDRFGDIMLAGIGDGALAAAIAAARMRNDIQGVILMSCPARPLAVVEGERARRLMIERGIDPDQAEQVMRARLDFIHLAARGMHDGALRESAKQWLSLMASASGGPQPSDAAVEAAVRWILLPGRVELLVLEPRRYFPRIQAPVLGIWGLSDDILDATIHADIAQDSIESLGGTAEMQLIPLADGMLRPVPEPDRSPSTVHRTFLPGVLTIIEAWTAPPKAATPSGTPAAGRPSHLP